MGLSSNILWHQTSVDGLKGILKDKAFLYSYSLEKIISGIKSIEAAFPMVSVCDFPLSELGEYIHRYGGYSIGLSREWGVRNGLSPVWYCDKNSSALKIQLEDVTTIPEDSIEEKDVYESFFYKFSYIKNYEGELPSKNYKTYRFYDEREFRLVPSFEKLRANLEKPYFDIDSYKKYKLDNKNSLLKSSMRELSFEWEDIRFIIVLNDKNIDEFKKIIQTKSGRTDLRINYFTNKQIKDDVIGSSHNITLDV